MITEEIFTKRNGWIVFYILSAIASFPGVYWVFEFATTFWGRCPVTAPIVVIESVNGEAFNVIRETQPVDECIRDWIGAYASWAGAIATVFVALPTLRFLRIQIATPAIEKRLKTIENIKTALDTVNKCLDDIIERCDTEMCGEITGVTLQTFEKTLEDIMSTLTNDMSIKHGTNYEIIQTVGDIIHDTQHMAMIIDFQNDNSENGPFEGFDQSYNDVKILTGDLHEARKQISKQLQSLNKEYLAKSKILSTP